jgi:hypothetical protein
LIRGMLNVICLKAEQALTATPSSGEISDKILKIHRTLSGAGRESLSSRALSDLALAEKCLAEVKLIDAPPMYASNPEDDAGLLKSARAWSVSLTPRGVLDCGRFAVGAGAFLDVLHAQGSIDEQVFALAQAERLMRHVEVKRDLALLHSFPESGRGEMILERLDVAILFARIAMRRRDLRFLNTAFKMNDAYLKQFGRVRLAADRRVRFLLSLAEQERAAGALL